MAMSVRAARQESLPVTASMTHSIGDTVTTNELCVCSRWASPAIIPRHSRVPVVRSIAPDAD